MKKIIGLITGIILLSYVGNAQINLATTLRQDSILKVERQIREALINGSTTVQTATIQLASISTSVTSSGTVSTGARAILFESSSNFVGTIDGISFDRNSSLPYSGGDNGKLPAIPYAISSGTITIRELR